MRKIIIADNQYITSEGIRMVLSRFGDFDLLKAETKKELISLLERNPDALLLLDYTLFDFQGVDELCHLGTHFARAHWVLFSGELSEGFIRRVYFSTPNFSFLYKDSSADEIKQGLQDALFGRRYVCRVVSNALLDNVYRQQTEEDKVRLTQSEKEILKAIAEGKTTKEIAQKRHSSTHTIISHRKNIFRKIEVNNIHEATKYAVKAGLVDLSDYFI